MDELSISFIVAQSFGFIALIAYVISIQIDNRRSVLFWRSIFNGAYGVQYLLLGTIPGLFACLIPIICNIVYARYENKKRIPTFWVVFFSALTLIFGLIFYDGPLSLIPVAHTIFCTIFLASKDLTMFRFTQAFSSILMFVFNLYIGAWVGLLIVFVQLSSAIISIVRFDSEKIKAVFSGKKPRKKSRR